MLPKLFGLDPIIWVQEGPVTYNVWWGYKFWYFLGYLGPNNHEKNIPGFMEPSPEIVPCYRAQTSSFQESVS